MPCGAGARNLRRPSLSILLGRLCGRSGTGADDGLLVAPPLYGRRDPHRFPVFGNRPARNIDAGGVQSFDDGVVREDVVETIGAEQQDLSVELLPSRRNDGLQSGSIKVL